MASSLGKYFIIRSVMGNWCANHLSRSSLESLWAPAFSPFIYRRMSNMPATCEFLCTSYWMLASTGKSSVSWVFCLEPVVLVETWAASLVSAEGEGISFPFGCWVWPSWAVWAAFCSVAAGDCKSPSLWPADGKSAGAIGEGMASPMGCCGWVGWAAWAFCAACCCARNAWRSSGEKARKWSLPILSPLALMMTGWMPWSIMSSLTAERFSW